jgi:hypothetical protein
MRPGVTFTPEQRPDGEHEAVVGVAVDYAYLNENGSDKRSGDGAFVKAVENERNRYRLALLKAMTNHAD